MKHHLKISISEKPQSEGIVRCRSVTMRERIIRSLLGEKLKLMILIPGNSVKSLDIKELPEIGD